MVDIMPRIYYICSIFDYIFWGQINEILKKKNMAIEYKLYL